MAIDVVGGVNLDDARCAHVHVHVFTYFLLPPCAIFYINTTHIHDAWGQQSHKQIMRHGVGETGSGEQDTNL